MTASVPLPACTMMIAVRGFGERGGELLVVWRRHELGLGVLVEQRLRSSRRSG